MDHPLWSSDRGGHQQGCLWGIYIVVGIFLEDYISFWPTLCLTLFGYHCCLHKFVFTSRIRKEEIKSYSKEENELLMPLTVDACKMISEVRGRRVFVGYVRAKWLMCIRRHSGWNIGRQNWGTSSLVYWPHYAVRGDTFIWFFMSSQTKGEASSVGVRVLFW